jgi:hypothetical protein
MKNIWCNIVSAIQQRVTIQREENTECRVLLDTDVEAPLVPNTDCSGDLEVYVDTSF